MAGVADIAWDDTAQRLCRLARQYAFLFGEEFVGTEHLLLAAAEITPADSHGFPRLCREGVLDAMDEVVGKRSGVELDESRPQKLTPRASEALRQALESATRANRPVSCRDVWFGLLSDEGGLAAELLARLGVKSEVLRDRLGLTQ